MAKKKPAEKTARNSNCTTATCPDSNEFARPAAIVGIGSSVGGLDALEHFFKHLPRDLDVAIVLAHHLNSDGSDVFVDLISNLSPLPVQALTEEPIEPTANCVFVSRQQSLVTLSENGLKAVEENDPTKRASSIDTLFQSLSSFAEVPTVGIVLSGNGNDGTLGLKTISDAGGMTIAQDIESAVEAEMPRSAAVAGNADHVLPPSEIPNKLAQYVQHLRKLKKDDDETARSEAIESLLPRISDALLSATEHDFRHYKSKTLIRRVARRMQVSQIGIADDYLRFLQSDREEAHALFRELLISVTAFFRDPDTFATLANHVIPKILETRAPDEPIRIWVPGCATGEEAYTLAILFREALDQRDENDVEVNIFGTDIDSRALNVAREGVYSHSISANVTSTRLKRFFSKSGKQFRVVKTIREMCAFSVHNLISDPPYSQMDLISCRNLLIYLGQHLQLKLIPLFHFGLKPDGYLLLGPSENLSSHTELFRAIDGQRRISQRKPGPARAAFATTGQRLNKLAKETNGSGNDLDIHQIAQRIVLDEFSARYVVVNESGHLLCTSGGLERFFEFPDGPYHNNVMKMARRGLRSGLRTSFSEAKKNLRTVVRDDLSLRTDQGIFRVKLTVQPMPHIGEDESLFMLAFQELGAIHRRDSTVDPIGKLETEATIEQLESELERTRTELESALQEQETSNEELKSSNEELLSMNEEMQSANEELRTSKEEINAGMEALSRTRRDLQNLLDGTRIATIFLDRNGTIKSFTPSSKEIYNLKDGDTGRPLGDITHNAMDLPPLALSDSPARSLKMDSVEVLLKDGRCFRRRVLNYLNDEQLDGFILTFVDITQEKRGTQLMSVAHGVSQQLTSGESFSDVMPGILETVRVQLNAEFCALWLPDPASDKLSCAAIARNESRDALTPFVESSRKIQLKKGEGFPGLTWQAKQPLWFEKISEDMRFIRENSAAEAGLVDGMAWPILTGQRVRGVIEFFTDRPLDREQALLDMLNEIGHEIGQFVRRTRLDDRFREEEARKTAVLEAALDCIITMDTSGRIVDFNSAAESTFGWKRAQVVGQSLAEWIIPEGYRDAHQSGFRNYLNSGESKLLGKRIELKAMRSDGSEFPIEIAINVSHLRDGTPFFTSYLRDISDRKRHEAIQSFFTDLEIQFRAVSSVEQIMAEATKRIVESLNLSSCLLVEFDEHASACEVFYEYSTSDSPSLLGSYDMSDFHSASERAQLSRGVATAIEDTAAPQRDPETVQRYATLGIGSIVNTPYLNNQKLRYAISALKKQPHPWQREELDLLQGLADRLYPRIERAKFESQLFESEQTLRAIYDGTVNHTGLISANGIVLDTNRASLEFDEIQRIDVVGKPYWEMPKFLSTPNSQETIQNAINQAREGELVRFEMPLVRSTNQTVWFEFSFYPIRNEQGEVNWIVPEGRDISHRKLAEKRMERQGNIERFLADASDVLSSSLRYEETLTKVTQLMVPMLADWAFLDLLTAEGETQRVEVAYANPNHHELAEQVVRFPAKPANPDHPPARALFQSETILIETFTEEMLIKASQNPAHEAVMRAVGPKSFLVVPLVARGISLGALTLILSDSDRRYSPKDLQLAKELARRAAIAVDNARLFEDGQRANVSKTEFLANMSHEIRTPMSAIMGYADILGKKLTDSEDLNCVEIIRNNGKFLLNIINDILDISKIEAGKMELLSRPIRIDRLVADVRSLMDVRASEKMLDFVVEFKTQVPRKINSDSKRLKQILVNLIGNAIKFTKTGSVQLIVRFLDRGPDSQLQFQVIDTGIGISPTHQAKLFQPFTQADASVDRNFGGTGLGLAISQRLADMLGGQITIESEPGKGSTFSLTINTGPIEETSMIAPQDWDKSASSPSDSAVPPGTCPRIEGRILVVDDRREIRFIAQHFVQESGGTIITGENGLEAIERVEEAEANGEPFDLVVMDMQMPVMDGYEATRRLRAAGFTRPIIALTAHAMEGDRETCLAAGCTDYISKPLDGPLFIGLISQYLDADDPPSAQPLADATPGKRKILVVDDGVQGCEAVAQLLQLNGHQVATAFDGGSGIETALRFRPDVVLLDIGLPDTNGVEVLNRLKQEPGFAKVRFIALTGLEQEAVDMNGFDHHLLKPLDIDHLEKLLK